MTPLGGGPSCATKRWTALFSTSTSYGATGISIKSSWDGIREAYLAAAADGKLITDLEGGGGKWSVVYSSGTGFTGQQILFPASQSETLGNIEKLWDDGKHITDIEHGPGGWAVVMSSGTGYTYQQVLFLSEWSDVVAAFEEADADVEITEIEYGGGKWAAVLTGGTDFESNLTWRSNYEATRLSMGDRDVIDFEYGQGGYKYIWTVPRSNRPPVAVDDNGGTEEVEQGWTYWNEVVNNDQDPDGDQLSILGTPECVSGCQYVVPGSLTAVSATRLEFEVGEGPSGGGDVLVRVDYVVTDGALSDTGRLTVTLRYGVPASTTTTTLEPAAPISISVDGNVYPTNLEIRETIQSGGGEQTQCPNNSSISLSEPTTSTVRATVTTGASGLNSVMLEYTGGAVTMTHIGSDVYEGTIGPFPPSATSGGSYVSLILTVRAQDTLLREDFTVLDSDVWLFDCDD